MDEYSSLVKDMGLDTHLESLEKEYGRKSQVVNLMKTIISQYQCIGTVYDVGTLYMLRAEAELEEKEPDIIHLEDYFGDSEKLKSFLKKQVIESCLIVSKVITNQNKMERDLTEILE